MEENPNPTSSTSQEQQQQEDEAAPREQQSSSRRTPFTNLSQVDADLALARTLQEQERAYMMLRMNAEGGSDYDSWEGGSYFHDEDEDYEEDDFGDPETDIDEAENNNTNNNDGGGDRNLNNSEEEEENDGVDAFDAHIHIDDDEDEDDDDDDEDDDDDDDDDDHLGVEFDPAVFPSDEAYARALQDAEEREMAARLLALTGIHDLVSEVRVHEDGGNNSQDMWEEVDPDELSYEELLALGEVVGTESRGLSADTIASLPSIKFKTGSSQNGSNDSCVICRLDYEDDETLTLLSCKHSYHPECLNKWLKINKVCPVCSKEVSSSGHN